MRETGWNRVSTTASVDDDGHRYEATVTAEVDGPVTPGVRETLAAFAQIEADLYRDHRKAVRRHSRAAAGMGLRAVAAAALALGMARLGGPWPLLFAGASGFAAVVYLAGACAAVALTSSAERRWAARADGIGRLIDSTIDDATRRPGGE